ncbi:hypothetical protein FSP39_008017 [Pinctada imbricata]|uniref:Reverse transcriptase domain-containing protein n=1 Tax=Pinctada imbricata TaxID=66713 RepID=A0AA89C280_PINIB|nr:hypothetical protein FSP39_008017 [Pinctada imbricata]
MNEENEIKRPGKVEKSDETKRVRFKEPEKTEKQSELRNENKINPITERKVGRVESESEVKSVRSVEVLEKSECLYATVEIMGGEKRVKLLVDTGSPVSIISADIVKMLGFELKDLTKTDIKLNAADGSNIEVLGSVDIELRMSSVELKMSFIVAIVKCFSGILGMDFMQIHDVKLNIRERVMTLKNESVRLERERSSVYKFARIVLTKTITVPAESEILVIGRLEGSIPGDIGLVEPTKQLKGRNMLTARTLIDVSNENIVLSIVNLSEREAKVSKDTAIGVVSAVQEVCQDRTLQGKTTENKELPEHLKVLTENLSDKLSDTQKQEVANLLINFQDVFKHPDGKLGQTDQVMHEIDTGDAKPIKLPLRRFPQVQKEVIEKELGKMIEQGVVEPSDSPWSANVCLARKKDNTWRFCIDYRKLNQVTWKDAYPLPKIDETLDTLAGSKWFNTLDMATGSWQIKMHPKDKHKTAFSTHKGLFQFTVLPFGLSNGPALFERLVEKVLGKLQWRKCLCYLDDIIVFGSDFPVTLDNLRSVFSCLRQANLKLKPSKCTLFQNEVSYLGHVVSEYGVKCDPKKTDCVENWPIPQTKSEIQSFLGLAGYYRRFIANFSQIAQPLVNLTRKGVQFIWGDECQNSFEKLKEKLTSAPVLSFPTTDGMFILDTDASSNSIGAVLSV